MLSTAELMKFYFHNNRPLESTVLKSQQIPAIEKPIDIRPSALWPTAAMPRKRTAKGNQVKPFLVIRNSNYTR
jgi:hypothetical protein